MQYFLFCCILVMFCLLVVVSGQTVEADSSKFIKSEYENWIAPYKLNIVGKGFINGETLPKLIIAVVTDKDISSDNDNPFVLGNGRIITSTVIYNDGKVEFFSQNQLGIKRSCCSQIENEKLAIIEQLLTKLPSDNSFLPPNGRRVVVQTIQSEKNDARVYDLANAPNEIWDLLRLTKSHVRSHVLWFQPETEWLAAREYDNGGLTVTSDSRQIITSGLNGPIKIWQTDSQNILREIDLPQNLPFDGIILSPDDSLAVISGWGVIGILDAKTWRKIHIIEEPFIKLKRFQLSKPHFIENGKFLLLESSEPALHIHDTKTWKRLPNLPEIPIEAISYYPAMTKKRAIYSLKDGRIFLKSHNLAPTIIDKAQLKYVSFSPDESKVAIVTTNHVGDKRIQFRIRIWNANNGKFEKELRPFEQDFCESVEGLIWTSDGKYFLAATKGHYFFTSRGISIWNVKTGRHRAELSGCPTEITGLAFLSGKNKLVAGCGDSKIRIWNLANAIGEISNFETLNN